MKVFTAIEIIALLGAVLAFLGVIGLFAPSACKKTWKWYAKQKNEMFYGFGIVAILVSLLLFYALLMEVTLAQVVAMLVASWLLFEGVFAMTPRISKVLLKEYAKIADRKLRAACLVAAIIGAWLLSVFLA